MTFRTLKDKLRTLKEILHGSAVHHTERDTEGYWFKFLQGTCHQCAKGTSSWQVSSAQLFLQPALLEWWQQDSFFPCILTNSFLFSSPPSGTSTENDCAFEPDYAIPPLAVTEGMQHIRIMEGMSRSLPSSPLLTHQSISVRLQPVKKLTGKDLNKVHWGFWGPLVQKSVRKKALNGFLYRSHSLVYCSICFSQTRGWIGFFLRWQRNLPLLKKISLVYKYSLLFEKFRSEGVLIPLCVVVYAQWKRYSDFKEADA